MMDGWVQPLHPVESSPFVVDSASGVVNQHYPFGIIRISSLPHTPAVQVIFVADSVEVRLSPHQDTWYIKILICRM